MSSKLIALILLTAVQPASFLLAQSSSEQEFNQLRAERDKATAVALDPINRRYKDGLDKLYRKAVQNSDLELAKKLQAELQAVGGVAAAANAGNPLLKPAPPPVTGADRTALKKLIENSEWSYWPIKKGILAEAPVGQIIFQKNGVVVSVGTGYPRQVYALDGADRIKLYHADGKGQPESEFRVFKVDFATKTATQDATLGTVGGAAMIKYVGPAPLKSKK